MVFLQCGFVSEASPTAGTSDLGPSIQAAHRVPTVRYNRVASTNRRLFPHRHPPVPIVKILALDCSTEMCSAALWIDGAVEQHLEPAGQRHSERLLPMVSSLLAAAGIGLRGLDAVAVATGPGTFTGLRIAVSVGQGLAFGADLPAVSVGTLEALAAGADAPRVMACLDARMDQIYFAAYLRVGGGLEEVLAPAVASPEHLDALPDGPGWIGVGNGFDRFAPRLAVAWPGLARWIPQVVPEARHVASIAAVRMATGLSLAPERLLPLYVRDRVALTTAER